jgi:hypothetical protein
VVELCENGKKDGKSTGGGFVASNLQIDWLISAKKFMLNI